MDNKEIKKEFGTIREIKEIIKEKQIKNEIRKNQIKHKKEELNLQLNAIIKEINEIILKVYPFLQKKVRNYVRF